MKKIFTTCLLALSMLSAMAQITIWTSYPTQVTHDEGQTWIDTVVSSVAYQYAYDEVDSITFVPYFYDALPVVAEPAEGYVTIIIQIPDSSECNGIAFKGTTNGLEWSGTNTYLNDLTAVASPEEAIKFEKIEGATHWFRATFKLGRIGLQGKICLIYKNDAAWEGQAKSWSYIKSTAYAERSDDGNVVVSTTGLVYIKIDEWQKSECNQHVVPRTVTVTIPDKECGREIPSIVGSFNGWNPTANPMTLVSGNTYTVTVEAEDGDEFKIAASVSGWDNELEFYDAEEDVFRTMGNIIFGTQTEFVLDYSHARWQACNEY